MNTGSTKWSIGNDGTDDSFHINNAAAAFSTNSELVITSGGNVGIGTTTPLEPDGNAAKFVVEADVTANLSVTGGVVEFINSDGDAYFRVSESTSLEGGMAWDQSDDQLLFNTGSNNYPIRIEGSEINLMPTGNVGIGITDPGDPLQVLTDSGGEAIAIEENSGGEQWELGVDSDGDLNFQDSGSAVVTFEDGGQVGIGTTGPNAILHLLNSGTAINPANTNTLVVQDSTSASTNSRMSIVSGNTGSAILDFGDTDDENAGNIAYSNNLDQLSFRTGATNGRMVIDSSGNFGIGTTTPSELLEINGSGNVRLEITSIGAAGSGSAALVLNSSGQDSWAIYSHTSDGSLRIANHSANDYLIIDTGGNVKPGTDATQKFGDTGSRWLSGTFADTLTVIADDSDTDPNSVNVAFSARNNNSGTDTKAGIRFSHKISTGPLYTPTGIFSYRDNSGTTRTAHLGFFVTGNDNIADSDEVMTITNAGFVGIGDTEPSVDLEITGDSTDNPQIILTADTNPVIKMGDGSSSGSTDHGFLQIYDDGTVDIQFSATGSDSYINGGANFGVGTTTPSHKLNVVGDGTYSANFSSGGIIIHRESASPFIVFSRDGTNVAQIRGAQETDRIGITNGDATSEFFSINTDSGNVGIGTSTPADPLDVDGNVTIRGNLTVGSNALFVNASGRVGIGTSSPSSTLEVSGSVAIGSETVASNAVSFAGGIQSTATGSRSFVYGDSSHTSGQEAIALGNQITVSGGNSLGIGLATSTSYTLSQANTMAIMGGQVGIGTTAPAGLLNMLSSTGAIEFIMNVTTTNYPRILMNAHRAGADEVLGELNGVWTGKKIGQIIFETGDDTSNKDDGRITFWTSSSAGSPSERMRIEPNGNIGIGTTTPADPLDVDGNVTIRGNLTVGNNVLFVNVSGTSGRVGIVTSSPDNMLQIGDGANAVSVGNTDNTLFVGPDGFIGRLILEGSLQADILLIDGNAEGTDEKAMQILTTKGLTTFRSITDAGGIQADNILVLNHSAGKVGIGTKTPANALEVVGSINLSGTLIPDNSCGLSSTVLQFERSIAASNAALAIGNGDILQGVPMACDGIVTAISGVCENCDGSNSISMEVRINGAAQTCDTAELTSNYDTDTTTCSLSFSQNDRIGCYSNTETGAVTGIVCAVYVRFD